MTTNTQPRIAAIECTSCGVVHQTSGGLPVGWSAKFDEGATWCSDCTRSGVPARTLNKARRR